MKNIFLFLLLTCFSFYLFAQRDTAYYSVVYKGKIKGGQKIWQTVPREYHYDYQFNDRGRGDSMTTTVRTNESGLIISWDAKGLDYYKNPYTELFSIIGDSAVWLVNGIRKSQKFNNEIYAANGAPGINQLVISSLLKQPNKRMGTIPEGFVHAEEPLLRNITLHGKTAKLKLVPVYWEPSPVPYYVWLTDDMHFFALVSGWSSTISKGYESWADSLFTIQEIASQGYYTKEIKNNSRPLSRRMILTHANIFHPASATVEKDMVVVVVDGKIESVYASAVLKKNVKADTIIDCKGKFLMPGLWDMHGHYGKEEGAVYLAGGVTHIRDMGNDKILQTYKKQIAANTLLGPDISFQAGFIDREDPFQGPTGSIIKNLEEGIKAIDEYHQMGFKQIKLYSAIKPEWVAPMAKHAHSRGMKVSGHIPAFMTAEQAINAGYDEITHMNFIMLNFMGDTIDTRTPARFKKVGELGFKLDLQSQEVKDFISLMKRKHIVLDPTMNVWQGMFDEFTGDTANFLKPVAKWVPDSWLTYLSKQSSFGNEENKTAYRSSFSNMMHMMKKLYDNGIMLVAGTDGGAANGLHHELELYVQAGIPANQVLKIATWNAVVNCNLQDRYGAVKAGREADLILIDGDPIANISDIRRVELVIKNKRLYQPKQLLSSQGWKYYY
ncbi:MAG: amidohydrolase family protein [Ferruginibacter sp.]